QDGLIQAADQVMLEQRPEFVLLQVRVHSWKGASHACSLRMSSNLGFTLAVSGCGGPVHMPATGTLVTISRKVRHFVLGGLTPPGCGSVWPLSKMTVLRHISVITFFGVALQGLLAKVVEWEECSVCAEGSPETVPGVSVCHFGSENL